MPVAACRADPFPVGEGLAAAVVQLGRDDRPSVLYPFGRVTLGFLVAMVMMAQQTLNPHGRGLPVVSCRGDFRRAAVTIVDVSRPS